MKIYSRTEIVWLHVQGFLYGVYSLRPKGWCEWIAHIVFLIFTLVPIGSQLTIGIGYGLFIGFSLFCSLCAWEIGRLWNNGRTWRLARGYIERGNRRVGIALTLPPDVKRTNEAVLSQLKGQL